jgi:hypothetical protein
MGLLSFFGGGEEKKKTGPWSQAAPYLTGRGNSPGVMPEAAAMYQQGGWSPEMQALLDSYQTGAGQVWENAFTPEYLNSGSALNQAIQAGEWDFTPQGPQQINAPVVDPTYNQFQPNAEAATYNAATVGGPQQINAQMIDSSLFSPGGAPQVEGGGFSPASMAAAYNSGYRPEGQVADFMSGGAYENKFLDGMYGAAARRVTDTFNESILPGIASDFAGSGGIGGSRQGIAEGLAAKEATQALTDLANNMYGDAYNLGFGAMSDLVGNQQMGDINRFAQNADMQQGANLNNANWAQQAASQGSAQAYGASGQNAANWLTGQGNILGALQSNQGADLAAQTSNTAYGQASDFANQNALNQAGQWNAGNLTQNSQFNTGLGADIAAQNTLIGNQTDQFNANNNMTAQMQNAGNQLAYNPQLAAANQQNLGNRVDGMGLPTAPLANYTGAFQGMMGAQQMPNAYDWNNLNNYSSVINQAAGQGSQMTGGYTPSPFGMAQMGLGLYSGLQSAGLLGSAAGSFIPMGPSDVRLKDNLVPLGEHKGLTVYRWDWNEDAEALGLHGREYGYVAQEVQEIYPHAIGERDGYLTVNYGAI